jgi:hypothetical protein
MHRSSLPVRSLSKQEQADILLEIFDWESVY